MSFDDQIKVYCTDNDKWVPAKLITHTDGWITALLQPGDVKITLKKTKPNIYVGNMSGYEFVYNSNNL